MTTLDVVLAIRRDGHEIILPDDAVEREVAAIYERISSASLQGEPGTLEALVCTEQRDGEGTPVR